MSSESNQILEDAELLVRAPKVPVIKPGVDPATVMAQFDAISSPSERLLTLFTSIVNFKDSPTLEARQIRSTFVASFFAGVCYGALSNTKDNYEQYKRQHNATIHANSYVARRHYYDTFLAKSIQGGISFGIKAAIISSIGIAIPFATITYRGELYLPDWLIAFGVFGSLSRTWLGTRAMLVGAGVGAVVGLSAFGLAKVYEIAGGENVGSIRYRQHLIWLEHRQAEHNHRLRIQTKQLKENLKQDYGAFVGSSEN